MNQNLHVKLVENTNSESVTHLLHQLNPLLDITLIKKRQKEMFEFDNYICFGLYLNDTLIGITCAWIMVRIYCGKQIEIDNVILDSRHQSKGYGNVLLNYIEKWAIDNDCETIELNTYVQNPRSHKFYFNNDYKILGFHFQKKL
ncbi:GNAT family N-acetyltransferase [Flavobacterium jejuense]|uniref:GNAT family N-acetyltransferase n=1 Tax=Flavobacterium jejuense TaxID=1544455 RepID=A0ABX0IPQ0_9FLAO|nr:GNAT family N-acetyltransferase [Flavobacterium jejuense]NHN25790.1 GNAT family N-acetyltransferase [Flavobacterium jejuense]